MLAILCGCAIIDTTEDGYEAKKPPRTVDAAPVDAAETSADASDPANCNPDHLNQSGCASGEKCTYALTSYEPFTGHKTCAPSGTQVWTQPCTFNANGVDNCGTGFFCHYASSSATSGICYPLCVEGSAFYNCTCHSWVTLGWIMDPTGYGVCR